MRFFRLLSAVWLLFVVVPTQAVARDSDRDDLLVRAVYADSRLWLLTSAGALFSIAEDTHRRADQDLPDPVLDICRKDGDVLAVTGSREGVGSWTVRRRTRGIWRIVGRVRQQGEALRAMDCNAGLVTLLSLGRIIELRAGGIATTALVGESRWSRVSSNVFGTRDHLYVGINGGEWGGGVQRIDRASGEVVTIEDDAVDRCGGGPLNTACDPVHAIAAVPWRPGCVAIAIGLVHFIEHGRLAQLCGTEVEELYAKHVSSEAEDDNPPWESDVAFFGLVRTGEMLTAVGTDGVYRIGVGGAVEFARFPRFRRIGGVDLSFDLPDVVLVVTQINRQASVSVGAPMVVAR